jgi:hypothetical protein
MVAHYKDTIDEALADGDRIPRRSKLGSARP